MGERASQERGAAGLSVPLKNRRSCSLLLNQSSSLFCVSF